MGVYARFNTDVDPNHLAMPFLFNVREVKPTGGILKNGKEKRARNGRQVGASFSDKLSLDVVNS
jgi:hypothetical protein